MPIPEHLQRLLEQFAELGRDGTLGTDAIKSSEEYASLTSDMDFAKKYLKDFYSASDEASRYRDIIVQLLIVAYRDAKKVDVELASSFVTAFISDYPGTTGTALLPRWTHLAESCFGFKAVAGLHNRSMIWQHASKLVLAMNEFLDGLFGFLILAWRCALQKRVNINVLNNNYGSKVHELSELTDGDNGAFYLLFRSANPKLRNGLAHGNAWYDYEKGVVQYSGGRQDNPEEHICITDFLLLAKLGCDLAQSYIAFIAAIILFENGEHEAISSARKHLIALWAH